MQKPLHLAGHTFFQLRLTGHPFQYSYFVALEGEPALACRQIQSVPASYAHKSLILGPENTVGQYNLSYARCFFVGTQGRACFARGS